MIEKADLEILAECNRCEVVFFLYLSSARPQVNHTAEQKKTNRTNR